MRSRGSGGSCRRRKVALGCPRRSADRMDMVLRGPASVFLLLWSPRREVLSGQRIHIIYGGVSSSSSAAESDNPDPSARRGAGPPGRVQRRPAYRTQLQALQPRTKYVERSNVGSGCSRLGPGAAAGRGAVRTTRRVGTPYVYRATVLYRTAIVHARSSYRSRPPLALPTSKGARES